MNLDVLSIGLQTALLLLLAPLITGCIRNWKANCKTAAGRASGSRIST